MVLRRLQFVLGTVCVYGLAAHGASSPAAASRLPSNIIVDPSLEVIVALMIDRSPTFREQSLRLAAVAHLRVRVIVRGSLASFGQSPCRADTMLRRYEYGRIDAVVRLPSTEQAPELIAHELEHVREYVDGVDFRYKAAKLGRGVWETRTGHYESTRAIEVGRRVAREVESGAAPDEPHICAS